VRDVDVGADGHKPWCRCARTAYATIAIVIKATRGPHKFFLCRKCAEQMGFLEEAEEKAA